MKKRGSNLRLLLAGAVVAAMLPVLAQAQQSEALVDQLVKKGVLTTQEAEDIKADLAKEFKETGGGKMDINKSVTKFKLYGDVRGRYEGREFLNRTATNRGTSQAWRPRYRLRFGVDADLKDGVKAGFQLTSGNTDNGPGTPDPRSGNQTFTQMFTYNTIGISRAYGEFDFVKHFKGEDLWLDKATVGFGKFANPLISTPLTWDTDIAPAGAWQTIEKKFDADGDEVTPFITAGQWVLQDNSGATTDADYWMVPVQVGTKVKFEDKDSLRFAATYYYWMGNETGNDFPNLGAFNRGFATVGQSFGQTTNGRGQLVNNSGAFSLSSLSSLVGYLDYTFAETWSKDVPLTLYTEAIYNPSTSDANFGNQTGFRLGDTKKKGQWMVGSYFNYLEQNAWADWFTDSDFAGGSINAWGYVIESGYAVTDSMTLNVKFFDTRPIRVAPGNGANILNGWETQRLQLDVNVRF